jgi:predicted membrane protein
MRSKLLRIVLLIVVVEIVAVIVGRVISDKMKRGDEQTKDFQVVAVCGGKRFKSRATDLTSGTVISTMGGVDLDLRDATLDPGGATLDLRLTLGGAQVTVPPDWAVDVEVEGPGGFEIDVTPPDELPEDAPKLHIHALARGGGAQITARAA